MSYIPAQAIAGQLVAPTFPVLANYTAVNTGTASLAQAGTALYLAAPAVGSRSVRAWYKAAPTAPYTVTAFIKANLGPDDGNEYGLGWRENSSGKLSTFAMAYANGALNWQWIDWTNPTTLSGTNTVSPNGNAQLSPAAGFYLRIADDNTNRTTSYSLNGINFIQTGSVVRTSFITPDQVLFMADPNSTTRDVNLTLYSWVEA